MTTPPLDLPAERITALRDIANAATPGPWTATEYDHNPGDEGVPIIGGGEVGSMEGHLIVYALTLSDEAQCEADGAHIAAFDPPTVLALLDRVEELDRDRAAVTVSRDGWQPRAEAAEKKVAAGYALAERYEKAFGHSGLAEQVRRALDGGA